MTTEWDMAIVGAGPAGSAAALAALQQRPHARVLLLDRASFPRDKSCGDGIAPQVLDLLATLGAGDVVDGWTPVCDLQLSRADRTVHRPMARPVHVIPRAVFDARLVERAVAAGAHFVQHRVRDACVENDCVVLDGQIRARTLISADGAYSVIRSALARPTPGKRAIAIRGYAPTPPQHAGRQLIRYGEGSRQPSYAWTFDRGDGLSNVGYGELVGDRARPTRTLLLEQLEQLIPGAVAHGTQWRAHYLPLSGRGWHAEQPDGPVLYAGDAAGLVNPMTGEGIYYAVLTGMLAGRTVVATDVRGSGRADVAARYRDAVRAGLNQHLQHTWAAARLAARPRIVEAGITAAADDKRTFDDLVELGLGSGRLTPRLLAHLVGGLVRNRLTPSKGH